MNAEQVALAWTFLEEGYRAQAEGDFDHAIELYRRSLSVCPTAEAHTYLGWSLHYQGKFEEAIEECKRAIRIDPEFGNPYNDIGAYLIAMERYDEAIPWLERAIEAKRYQPRHFPFFNLGRVYVAKGLLNLAQRSFQKALRLEPKYSLAQEALKDLRRLVN